MSDVLLTSEAARELGVAASTIRRLEKQDVLRATKASGGTRVFSKAEIQKLLQERKNQNRKNK
jgi:excisionase family DNA binding protein